jgi:signal transduction histidine kinase
MEKNTEGNGLKNMPKRMDKIGGTFQILNNATGGTQVVLGMPLTNVNRIF